MKLSLPNRRRLVAVLSLLALFTLAGFFALPPILKSQLERRLSAALGRPVTVEKVRVNPYALSLTLENFAIGERSGPAMFLGWRRLYVRFDAWSSLRGEWVLSDIRLDGFQARVVVNPDQSLNFSDLLAKFASPPDGGPAPSKPGRPLRVASLSVNEAKVDFSDLSRRQPFATTVGPLTFALTGFRTAGAEGAPYRFAAVTESGESLRWSGSLQAVPFRSVGELNLENIVLPKYAPYYADLLSADLSAGRLSLHGRYELDLTAGHRRLKLSDGAIQLRNLELRERATREIALDLPSLDVAGVEADALARKIAVQSVDMSGGRVRGRREKNGAINLVEMLGPPTGVSAATGGGGSAVGAAEPPDLTVGALSLEDFAVEILDQAAPRPAQLALSQIRLSLKNISLAPDVQMPLQVALSWAPRGAVRLEGAVGINPVQADLKVDIAGLGILPLSPYLEQFTNARIAGGVFTAALQARLSPLGGASPAAALTGDVKIESFGLVSGRGNEELAGFGALELRGLSVHTAPALGVALKEIDVTHPYARVVVAPDKSLNLAAAIRTGPPSAAPAAPVPPPQIEIGKIVIDDGDYQFTDRSIEPNVRMAIDHFGGSVSGLSSGNPTKATVDLKATVDGAGPVSIAGKLDPLSPNPSIDLKIDFKNVDLLPLSPYSGKYAGYELARGKLALAVNVLVEGKKIDAANVITLDGFTFGDPVKSADATGLPVRLGVALLKDLDGKIVIDVPVQGRTDDPNFRVGRVVLRVVVNLLTKAAVSPFALLGSAFGGGGDELGYQEFAPGSSALQPEESGKLQTMVQALTKRPGLSLGLEGGYDVAADAYALKRIKLAERVRRGIWEKKHLADPNIPPPAELTITPEENAAEVKRLFDAEFPPGTQFGTPLPSPPAVVAPPPPPASWLKRAIRAVTFQNRRARRAAQKENDQLTAAHRQAVNEAIATGLPVSEMTGRLAEAIPIDDNDLRALAQARAQRVRDYFADVGKIGPDRLFLANAAGGSGAAKSGQGPRVILQLQ